MTTFTQKDVYELTNAAYQGRSKDVVKSVETFGLDIINEKDEHGSSAVMTALCGVHQEIVDFLMVRGADAVGVLNADGKNAIEKAKDWVEFLCNRASEIGTPGYVVMSSYKSGEELKEMIKAVEKAEPAAKRREEFNALAAQALKMETGRAIQGVNNPGFKK